MTETHDSETYAVFDHPRNKKLISQLENAGGKVFKIPLAKLIKIEELQFSFPVEEINLFDWIIFADVFAAEFFLEFLNDNNFDLFELDDLHICALGEAVAERLRFAQIHTDVIPVFNTTEKIIESIENYIYDERELAEKRFLLIQEAAARFDVAGRLEEKHAKVSEGAIYRAEYSPESELPRIKALVKGGAIDELIFTAPEDLPHFRFLFRDENITDVLREAKISAADEATRQTLRENRISSFVFRIIDKKKET